ncbi:MAG: leucine-rich repeat protein [Promethearchaeota archaeon]|nr:MAG: leucine-rich repeat protein [Candidatus Lokiarchaeota archaeon]
MELHPDYIIENLDQIGRKEGLNLLREWIESSSESITRQKALEYYGSIDTGKNFKFFEHLFLSDEDLKLRLIAGQILKHNYSNNKKLISLLEYTLRKVDNVNQRLFAVNTLTSLDTVKARKLILEYLKELIKKEFKDNVKELPREIYIFNYNEAIPGLILDICNNLILYTHYTNKCRYHVTVRKGKIISLNCESSNLGRLSEITELNSLKDLEHLQLTRNNLHSIDGIQILEKLRTLDLSHNKLIKIENLESSINLEELNLANNEIQRINGLDSLKKLKKLSLNNNLIEDIDNLSHLTNLEELNLSHNAISEIKHLDNLNQLLRLNLSFNQIEKLTGIKSLKNLQWLYLNDNKITQISEISTLHKLKGLYLSNNLIEKIEALDNLVDLKKLELSNNKITRIDGLKALNNLQELYLDNNKIKEFEGLENLTNLIMLHLGRNEIIQFRNKNIDCLKNLNFLFLNENPLDQKSWEQFKKRFKYP